MSRMIVVVEAFSTGNGHLRLMRGRMSRTRWRRAWKYSVAMLPTNWTTPRVRL